MTKEEIEKLVAEAKIRYPVGAIFDSLGGNRDVTIRATDIYKWDEQYKEIVLRNSGDNRKGVVWRQDEKKWAEIKNKEILIPQVINNYSIF